MRLVTIFYFVLAVAAATGTQLPWCRVVNGTDGAAIRGRWVAKPPASLKTFPCACGGHDTPQEFLNVPDSHCRGDPRESPITGAFRGYPSLMGHGCACQIQKLSEMGYNRNSTTLATNFTLAPEMWDWQPETCSLPQWNATEFCETLTSSRTILMVGDSTMQQTAASLYSMLVFAKMPAWCLDAVKFELSDYLVYHPDESRGSNFLWYTKVHKPTILIIGSSAHYDRAVKEHLQEIGESSFMDFFVPKLFKDVEYLREWPVFCPKHILFKTQNPGHVGCETYNTPVLNATGLITSDLMHTYNDSSQDKYSWRLHTSTDAHVVKFFIDAEQRNISHKMDRAKLGVIDMSPVYLRPDGHALADCLHYCTPGPLDLFAIYLLTALKTGELD